MLSEIKKIFWTSTLSCSTIVYCKGGMEMAQITLEQFNYELKCDVINKDMTNHFRNSILLKYDNGICDEMLLIKHIMNTASKINLTDYLILAMTNIR